ncbi:hypothetical protein ACP3TY_25165 [Pseudomonas rustica]|jgi:hypothetical protein|uniref:hypothetical protein n=1 Tax=Pseudomonas TaxID=286 RepID=UPI00381C483C
MGSLNRRGIFLQKLGPTVVDPKEVLVQMHFAYVNSGWDAEKSAETFQLEDSSFVTAASYDGGHTFSIRNEKDVDGDGDIDAEDQAKLLALAKAYASINTP